MVILTHCNPNFPASAAQSLPPIIHAIVTNGDKGVTLFYMISAFTLCLSFLNKKHNERQPIRNYFIRRIFRILPLYYFAILLSLTLPGKPPSISSILSNIFFLHGLNPYWINSTVSGGWSVGIEMLFYLFFPIFFFRIKSLGGAINTALIFIIIAKFVTSIMFKNPLIDDGVLWSIFVYENLLSQIPVFLIGICLFYINNTEKIQVSGKTYLLLAIILIIHLPGGKLLKPHYLFAIAYAIAAYGFAKYQPKIILNKLTIWLGKYSYSLYLNHIIVLKVLSNYHLLHFSSNIMIELVLGFILCLCLSIIISLITYNLIELPFQIYGKLLIKNIEAKYTLENPELVKV